MLNEDSISLDPLNLGEMNALISLWHLSRGPLESSYHCIIGADQNSPFNVQPSPAGIITLVDLISKIFYSGDPMII